MSYQVCRNQTSGEFDVFVEGLNGIDSPIRRFLIYSASSQYGLWAAEQSCEHRTYSSTTVVDACDAVSEVASVSDVLRSFDKTLPVLEAYRGQTVLTRAGVPVSEVIARVELALQVLHSAGRDGQPHVDVADVKGDYSGVVVTIRVACALEEVIGLNRQLIRAERGQGLGTNATFDVSFSAVGV